MTIRLRVLWPNAGHSLLPEAGAKISVQADGSDLDFALKAKGLREFEIPDGTSSVALKVEFSVSLRAVGDTPPQTAVVLSAAQKYSITNSGNTILPEVMAPFQQQHPLIDSKVLISQHAAILAQIHTDFVDITPFWKVYTRTKPSDTTHADEYASESDQTRVKLVALGYTRGLPLIWFASIPNLAAVSDSTRVSALVYYRPANGFYTRVDQAHTMFRLNRFLLAPNILAPESEFWKLDHFTKVGQDFCVWLRCGFEESLFLSRKPVVLIHPWPSGLAFGDSANARLPGAAEAALRFLWSEGHLAANRHELSLGRLGIMGYSAGGDVLWSSLQVNADRVSEVYAFDANHTGSQAGRLKAWFKRATARGDDPRLFMAVGLHVTAGSSVIAEDNARMTGAGTTVPAGRLLSIPHSAAEYAQGTIPNLVDATAGHPELLNDGNARHQFPVFGRYPRTPGEPALSHPRFLQQFLELSGF